MIAARSLEVDSSVWRTRAKHPLRSINLYNMHGHRALLFPSGFNKAERGMECVWKGGDGRGDKGRRRRRGWRRVEKGRRRRRGWRGWRKGGERSRRRWRREEKGRRGGVDGDEGGRRRGGERSRRGWRKEEKGRREG